MRGRSEESRVTTEMLAALARLRRKVMGSSGK